MKRLLCTALLTALAGAAHAQEAVLIPTAGMSSAPAPLKGLLFRATGDVPHPAVVMMHGCGGAYTSKGELNARHRMWGEFLAGQGITALMLDSLTPRGEKSLCTQKFADRKIKEADRRGDAYAALAWLQGQPDIAADRIGVLGWSHGGGTTLGVITRPVSQAPRFKAAVSFYPGCTSRLAGADRFHPYAPLFLLIGASDDWTPAAPCIALTEKVAARGEPMQIQVYPDTYHDFDNPGLHRQRVRHEVPNGVHPGQGVTIAPNPEAREDAKRRVLEFFKQQLQ